MINLKNICGKGWYIVMGKVYLVGAGPGDPELITVKGLNHLKNCDCVVYDRLAGEELLSYTPQECEHIYVGKQPGIHYRKQEEINNILVECAGKYDKVVRLKGGDPFVFGRGGEEIEALIKAGIEYEVIPGITSAIAVPECAGIPVTHREIARSFHVITGHTKKTKTVKSETGSVMDDNYNVAGLGENVSESLDGIDFENLAKQEGTIVFLMGLSNLATIADKLMAYGKPGITPAAVISDGTTIYEKQVRGTLADIVHKVESAGLRSPAVIVIGDTADKNYRYVENSNTECECENFFEGYMNDNEETEENVSILKRDEYGNAAEASQKNIYENTQKIRVGVTATPSLYYRLHNAFSKEGIPVVSVCEMEVQPDKSGIKQLSEIIRGSVKGEELTDYSWIVFTSQNGVRLFFETFRKAQADYRNLAAVKFAVLGSGTRDTLLQYGFHADFVPSKYTIHTFCEEFAKVLKETDKILIPRAYQGSKELYEYQDKWLGESTILTIYDVNGRATRHMGRIGELTHLIFASASGVEAFMQELEKRGQKLPEHIKLICIGEITAARLSEHGRNADVIASIQDVDGLLKTIKY